MRRVAVAFAVAAVAAVTAACDPEIVPTDPREVDVTTELRSGGVALTTVKSGRSAEGSRDVADEVAATLFHGLRTETYLDDNSGGRKIAVARTDGVFQPGAEVPVAVDTTPLPALLEERGFDDVSLTVCLPHVPLVDGPPPWGDRWCEYVEPLEGEDPVDVDVVFAADAWRFWTGLPLPLAFALLVVAAWNAVDRAQTRRDLLPGFVLLAAGAAVFVVTTFVVGLGYAWDHALLSMETPPGGQVAWGIAVALNFATAGAATILTLQALARLLRREP